MASDRINPVTKTVLYPRDRQSIALVATHITTNHREATGAIFEQAQVALAFVEQVLLDRCQGQVKIEPGERLRVVFDLYAWMEFADIGPQTIRAHAKKYPLNLTGQFLPHVGYQIQITRIADTPCPSNPWQSTHAPLPFQATPPVRRKAISHHPDIAVHTRIGIR